MTAEFKAINMMSSKRNIQNVIRQKTHVAPSHRDVDELESEFMEAIAERKAKFMYWDLMCSFRWHHRDNLNPQETLTSSNPSVGSITTSSNPCAGPSEQHLSPVCAASPASNRSVSESPISDKTDSPVQLMLPLVGPENPGNCAVGRVGGGRSEPAQRGKGKQMADFVKAFA